MYCQWVLLRSLANNASPCMHADKTRFGVPCTSCKRACMNSQWVLLRSLRVHVDKSMQGSTYHFLQAKGQTSCISNRCMHLPIKSLIVCYINDRPALYCTYIYTRSGLVSHNANFNTGTPLIAFRCSQCESAKRHMSAACRLCYRSLRRSPMSTLPEH